MCVQACMSWLKGNKFQRKIFFTIENKMCISRQSAVREREKKTCWEFLISNENIFMKRKNCFWSEFQKIFIKIWFFFQKYILVLGISNFFSSSKSIKITTQSLTFSLIDYLLMRWKEKWIKFPSLACRNLTPMTAFR